MTEPGEVCARPYPTLFLHVTEFIITDDTWYEKVSEGSEARFTVYDEQRRGTFYPKMRGAVLWTGFTIAERAAATVTLRQFRTIPVVFLRRMVPVIVI
jgi:hypothetical protein